MPSGELSGYPQGHVNRVYDFVIVPACRMAGYWPTRADVATYTDPLEAVKELVDSDIVLCDVSAKNSNALYAVSVRHALSLPVTIVKDTQSSVPFGLNDLGVTEYDESLRIDTVQKAIDVISAALKDAAESKKGRHELLNQLEIGLPEVQAPVVFETNTYSSAEVSQKIEEEKPKPKEPRLPIISPLPDYVGDAFTEEQIDQLKAGDTFFHLNHGKGKLNFVKKSGKEKLANIAFDSGTKLLVLVASDFFRRIKD